MRALIIATLMVFAAIPVAASEPQQLKYSVVYSDEQGVTHFWDEYLPWRAGQQGNLPSFVSP
jgi:hypothetical protein